MGYVAVQGGKEAIHQANLLTDYNRRNGLKEISISTIEATMKPLVDQVMSEASLYAPELSAMAIKQAGGSMEEAVFLLRAHRSSLPRLYYSQVVETREMFVTRRISASFKDIPGGQILGPSLDYRPRFLNFEKENLTFKELQTKLKEVEEAMRTSPYEAVQEGVDLRQLPKVVDYLSRHQLVLLPDNNNQEPDDITKRVIRFPASRSQRLQSLTRGQTGAVTSLGYAKIRQYANHPNIGELRVGQVKLSVILEDEGQEEAYYFGKIELTEVESLFVGDIAIEQAGRQAQQTLVLGYGACFGQNETKAIAMSILDHALEYKQVGQPTSDEEFVLYHIDSVESTGFISHLKLPHYVTFQSELDAIRRMDAAFKKGGEEDV